LFPKRILFTIPNFLTAGSAYVVLDILRGLERKIFEPRVCVLRRGGLDYKVQELGVPLMEASFTFDPKPRATLLSLAHQASRPFKDLEIDIWHSWHYLDDYTEPLIAKFAGAKKWIYTKKNMSWGGNGWRLRSLFADQIVVNNPQMKEAFFSSVFFSKKVSVIPQGVDVNRFQFTDETPLDLHTELEIKGNIPIIGCVANLTPVKDHRTLIKAVANSQTKPHLILIGKGESEYLESLRTLGNQLGINERIHYVGFIANEDLPCWLSAFDIFTLSSENEGLPVALLEAMSCERACIATRCGGPEVVIEDGGDGFLVEVGDYQGLAQRIDMLVSDPGLRQEIGTKARQKIISSFSHCAQGASYNRLYRQLARLT